MRYFSYNEYDPESQLADSTGGYIATLSEAEIREQYFPYWQKKMFEKYGEEHVRANYSFEDCLEDWKTIHWAWESDSAVVQQEELETSDYLRGTATATDKILMIFGLLLSACTSISIGYFLWRLF
jgi:hypothetical protein